MASIDSALEPPQTLRNTVALVGNGAVGKSSIVQRFLGDLSGFNASYTLVSTFSNTWVLLYHLRSPRLSYVLF